MAEIEQQGWSLYPGRYIAPGTNDVGGDEFAERFGPLVEEFETLSSDAAERCVRIRQVTRAVLD